MKRVFGILAVMSALFLCWSFSYWFTSWFFPEIHYIPPEFARQIINSILGFFLFGCCIYFITHISWVKERQEKHLLPLIHAMKMMAEGNFNIDLSYYNKRIQDRDHPYTKIVESISHMANKLGEMEEMRQEFISNVSHEIQSPLTSISGFAHALKNDDLNQEERNHYLQIIETECNRLSKLSENLLKLTSLESDHTPFEPKNYRLDHQLRRIILASEPQWIDKQINMDIDLEKLHLSADEDLMDQVWINLIHNSIKFTPNKGTITVEAIKTTENNITVRIKDSGIGISKDSLMHIFERFYKADQSRNRNAGGSGLGLSIVKKIIDLHKGEIHVKSELEKGTEITVILKQTF
jgi:two-component system, OmpR family, phosphate regulon sensor histidine kinase PhoR